MALPSKITLFAILNKFTLKKVKKIKKNIPRKDYTTQLKVDVRITDLKLQ